MYKIDSMPNQIDIGYTGETQFRAIEIDMKKWMDIMPDGVPSIVHIRPGETPADAYIANTTFEDNVLTWLVSAGDLGEIEGTGQAQIWLEEEENNSVIKRGKSIIVATQIHKAIDDASSEVPDPQESWMEQMTALKVATVNAADDAADAKTDAVAAKTAAETAQGAAEIAQGKAEDAIEKAPYVDSTTGNWFVWDAVTEQYVDTEVHAQGPQGPQGEPGSIENVRATGIKMSMVDDTTVYDAIGSKLNKSNAAADYSSSSTYAVGEYCLHNGTYYRCNTAISTAEAWNSSHWTETTVAEQLEHLENNIARPIEIQLDNVSNTSGSYTHTTYSNLAVATMKAIQIEVSNPSAFKDDISVTMGNGYVTLSCNSVAGSSTVTITAMRELNPEQADPTQITPSDFDVLAGRIGSLSNLTTTDKSSTVFAINEVNSAVSALKSNKANFNTLLKDTRLPSTNQQIENVAIFPSTTIMYLGNSSTINDVIVQTTQGDVSIPTLNSKFTTEVLTAIRTENTLVNSTAFARLYFYKKSEFYYATFNLGVTTAVNSMADFVEIGRITGWNAMSTADVTIAPQSGSNKVMLAEITDNGIIKIYGANGLEAGFYRAIIIVPKT